MNQLSDKDLELVGKYREETDKVYQTYNFTPEGLAALLAERDAEPTEDLLTIAYMSGYGDGKKQQPNAEAVAWINKDHTYVELSTKSTVYGSHTIPLFTHAPSQGISRERLISILESHSTDVEHDSSCGADMAVREEAYVEVADAILAALNPAQETKP